jgi:hypothetical protein
MTTGGLKETLKHCPDGTLEALVDFRASGNTASLATFSKGQCFVTSRRSGLDSLPLTETVIMIEECLDISIPEEDLLHWETFGALNDYLKQKGTEKCDPATSAPS